MQPYPSACGRADHQVHWRSHGHHRQSSLRVRLCRLVRYRCAEQRMPQPRIVLASASMITVRVAIDQLTRETVRRTQDDGAVHRPHRHLPGEELCDAHQVDQSPSHPRQVRQLHPRKGGGQCRRAQVRLPRRLGAPGAQGLPRLNAHACGSDAVCWSWQLPFSAGPEELRGRMQVSEDGQWLTVKQYNSFTHRTKPEKSHTAHWTLKLARVSP
jgi:hypothetical protein